MTINERYDAIERVKFEATKLVEVLTAVNRDNMIDLEEADTRERDILKELNKLEQFASINDDDATMSNLEQKYNEYESAHDEYETLDAIEYHCNEIIDLLYQIIKL